MHQNIRQSFLIPCFEALELPQDEREIVEKAIFEIILTSLLTTAAQSLDKETYSKLETNLKEAPTPQEKLQFLDKSLANSPEAKKAIEKYLENDLPQMIETWMTAFLEKATREQKAKFFSKMEAAGAK